jgi:hypothetical protein
MTGASIFSRGGGTTTGQATMEATSSSELPCSHSISSGKVRELCTIRVFVSMCNYVWL